jgi:hypothetical protein
MRKPLYKKPRSDRQLEFEGENPSKRLSIGLTIRCSKSTTYCTDRSYKWPENVLTNQLTNRNQKTAERDIKCLLLASQRFTAEILTRNPLSLRRVTIELHCSPWGPVNGVMSTMNISLAAVLLRPLQLFSAEFSFLFLLLLFRIGLIILCHLDCSYFSGVLCNTGN